MATCQADLPWYHTGEVSRRVLYGSYQLGDQFHARVQVRSLSQIDEKSLACKAVEVEGKCCPWPWTLNLPISRVVIKSSSQVAILRLKDPQLAKHLPFGG